MKGKAGRTRKDAAKFEWGEVDDITQGDMLLPAKKKKRVPKRFEKIESTLTVGGPEADPYEIKRPVRRPVTAASLGGDDLAIPSYGKMLDEEEDEFSVFLRNAEKAEEREKNRPKSESPKSGKTRKSAKSGSERPPQKMVKKNVKKGTGQEKTSVSADVSSPPAERSVDPKSGGSRSPRKNPPKGSDKGVGKRDEPKRRDSESSVAASNRAPDGKRPAGRPNPQESKRGPERPSVGNPIAGFKEKVAEIREYGLARMKRIGFSQSETEEFLAGVSGIEKIVGLIDVLLHSSVVRLQDSAVEEAFDEGKRDRRSEFRAGTEKAFAPEKGTDFVPDVPSDAESASDVSAADRTESPAQDRADQADRRPKDRGTNRQSDRKESRTESQKESRAESRTDAPKSEAKSRPSKKRRPDDRRASEAVADVSRPTPPFVSFSADLARGAERDHFSHSSPVPNRENWTFEGVPLSDAMLTMLNEASYEKPTPIQSGTISRILAGRDIMGQSQTGSGKTAAFMIPIIERIEGCEPGDDPVALIVVPTRELAVQIRDETVKLSRNREIVTVACYGGKPIADQIKKMRGGVDIVVGTPGRILDLTKRQALSLARLKWVVLDEADRMLDIGFRPDIERILKLTPKERQTLLFSATLAEPVVRLAQRYMSDPETCDFSEKDIAAETIEQFYVTVDRERKFEALVRLLHREDPQQAIVFCRTKRGVDKLGRGLVREFKNWSVAAIHGDLTQSSRDHIMRAFRDGKIKILVATDVVGRGIDVTGISHIINYDIPQFCDDYVHRVGRTGRMGREGIAFTLVTSQEGAELTRIEMRINRLLKRTELEGFEAFTRPDDLEKEEETKEPKAVFGKPLRRVRRAL